MNVSYKVGIVRCQNYKEINLQVWDKGVIMINKVAVVSYDCETEIKLKLWEIIRYTVTNVIYKVGIVRCQNYEEIKLQLRNYAWQGCSCKIESYDCEIWSSI